MAVSPYQNSDKNKKQQVEQMFDHIAPKYDFLNHFLSLGIDKLWRRKAVRLLKKGGVAFILEFSKPKYFPFKQIYRCYFLHVLPRVGRLISHDISAYTYLPESVMEFPDDQIFLDILKGAGFAETRQWRLSLGIATIYLGRK